MKFINSLIYIAIFVFISSCTCCGECDDDESCFPESTSEKLRICLSELAIQCPEKSDSCYLNRGDFYTEAWVHLKGFLETKYDSFITVDPLVSGIFENVGGSGEDGLPQCNLPPLPGGSGDAMINSFNQEKLVASILSVSDSETEKLQIPDEELLYYIPQKPGETKTLVDSGITITKFIFTDIGDQSAYDFILNHYETQIDDNPTSMDPPPFLDENLLPLMGSSATPKTAKRIVLDHRSAILTYLIEINSTTLLRIRFRSDKISDLDGLVEFYE